MKEKETKRIVIGFDYPTILTIIFIVLKLLNKIQWSWWLVFAPAALEWGFVFLVILAIALFGTPKRK